MLCASYADSRTAYLVDFIWIIYLKRIWSTDWFYRRDEQVRKLKAALEAARGGSQPPAPAAAAGGRGARASAAAPDGPKPYVLANNTVAADEKIEEAEARRHRPHGDRTGGAGA